MGARRSSASGELSDATADLLAACVQLCLLARPRHVALDLSGITTLGPSAVTTLLGLRDAARANDSDVEFTDVSRAVRDVLESNRTPTTLPSRQDARTDPAASPAIDGQVPEAREGKVEPTGRNRRWSGVGPPDGRRFPRLRRLRRTA